MTLEEDIAGEDENIVFDWYLNYSFHIVKISFRNFLFSLEWALPLNKPPPKEYYR